MRRFTFWAILLAMLCGAAFMFAACEKEEQSKEIVTAKPNDNPHETIEDIKLAGERLELRKGAKGTMLVEKGSGTYTAKAEKATIAEVKVSGNQISVTALEKGETKVTVTDEKTSKTATFTVVVTITVPDLKLAKKTLDLKKGEKGYVTVEAGSGTYTAEATKASLAEIKVNGNTINVTALEAGETDVVVTDGVTGKTDSFKLTVQANTPDIKLANAKLVVKLGTPKSMAVEAGSGKYSAVAEDPEVADLAANGNEIVVTPKKLGRANVTVTDTETAKTAQFVLLVVNNTSNTHLQLSATELYLELGTDGEMLVKSGSGSYSAESSQMHVATVTVEGDKIKVHTVAISDSEITVTDDVTDETATFTVKVSKLHVENANLDMNVGVDGEMRIIGGSNDFGVESETQTVATATVDVQTSSSGTNCKVIVHPVGPGTSRITVTDNKTKATVFFTAKVQAAGGSTAIAFDWVDIKAGTFMMGDPSDYYDFQEEARPQHKVTLTAFKMSSKEVTYEQFDAYCADKGLPLVKAEAGKRGQYPVANVTYDEALAFCAWASEKLGKSITLPTEAQWEYACRAETTTPWYTGTTEPTKAQAHYGFYPWDLQTAQEVGQLEANPWGLYDMYGNVFEWCLDWFGDYDAHEQTNPTGATIGAQRVRRGGSWQSGISLVRSAYRGSQYPESGSATTGFRVVCNN